ncbi:MAG: hypothetical protein GY757_44665, partial [bacterium]|nr:hypothetical protein [bacterium]
GIRAKLQDPAKKEIGFEIIKQIKTAIKTNDDFEETSTDESNLIDQFDADFDF